MLFIRLFLIINIICFGFNSFAQAELVQIRHSMIGDNKYRVTLSLDNQTKYQVMPDVDKVAIDFTNTEFAVKSISHKLDGRFLKTILKSNKIPNNLRIILELSKDTKFDKTYSLAQDGQLFVTIEFSNDKLSALKAVEPAAKKKLEPKRIIVMIDPGHGGVDKGTIGSNFNTFEKNLSLAYAKEFRRELKKYPQYQVIMTRDKDVYLSLEERKQQAQKMKADLFISIHADANSDPNLRGASIYTLSQEAMDQESAALSERENKADILKNDKLLKQNKDIANVLINMVYQDTQNASINLAKATTENLSKKIYMLQKPHRSAELKVLKGVDIPAILIELGYLSNKSEEKLLNTVMHKKLFTQSLVQGINQYSKNLK